MDDPVVTQDVQKSIVSTHYNAAQNVPNKGFFRLPRIKALSLESSFPLQVRDFYPFTFQMSLKFGLV